MNSRAFRRGAVAVAAFSASAIVLAGCAGGAAATRRPPTPNEQITLTLATFNDFGYDDELLQEYMDENPNIKIVHNKAAISQDARTNYFAKLGKEGLADIEAVEVDWFTEAMQYSDLLAEVPDSAKGRWLDWKEAAATDPDGRLVGFGTDIGPQAICYRADLFAAAGLPSTPDEVAALFDGDWDNYFDVADQYKAATGKPMIDAAHSVFQGMVNQIEFPYDEPDGTVVATDNPELEDAYNAVVERAIPNAAYADAVERRLERVDGQRRVRLDAVPRVDARHHRGQRTRGHRLGGRQRIPQRRRQLGRFVPDRSGERQERRGGARPG